jgi:ketosteroid isomerase-like protein
MVERWLLITASRQLGERRGDRELVRDSFVRTQRHFTASFDEMGIVHGAARGGDQLADSVAKDLGWTSDPVPCTRAEWERYGRSAGHRRNERMVRRRTYAGCIAFPIDRSPGTRGCMVLAEDAGITVWNRGDPPLPDGLYQVTDRQVCAAFEVRRGLVVEFAPKLRYDLDTYWRMAMAGKNDVVARVQGWRAD